jgi:Lrp/AsnC family leucine-responsive transcriptional regulator
MGKSPGAVGERIARLEGEGVIQGYFARVDPARLGAGMLAIVGAQAAHDSNLPVLVDRILEIQECEHVFVVTGRWDLLIHLRVRDQHHLTDVLFNELWKSPGFRHSETMIAVHQAGVPRFIGNFESSGIRDSSGSQNGAKTQGAGSRRKSLARAAAGRGPRRKLRGSAR